jgi:hypothetical protein
MVAQGPRAAEDAVLAEVDGLLRAAREDPALLGSPVVVVVPSKSLRLHLAAELVRRRGRAAAGLEVVTLYRLAAGVLERAGEPIPSGEALFGMLARRFAHDVPALADALDELVEGYGPVAGTVRDLVDAGFAPELLDPLLELFESAPESMPGEGGADSPAPWMGNRAERERAAALARLAAAVERGMEAVGAGGLGHLFRRASELLREDAARLDARAVLIHGFANATGVASDLLEALLSRPGSLFVLDRPPHPVDPAGAGDGNEPDLERPFTERLFERMKGIGAAVERWQEPPPPSRLDAFAAPGAGPEAREIARRIRALLDSSDAPPPETIGVVVRELSPDRLHGTALRRAFEDAGIPFSGVGAAGPLLPEGRRVLALLDLLRRREATPTGRWLDAVAALAPGDSEQAAESGDTGAASSGFDLRLAFHSLGAGRLGQVAALPPARFGRGGYALPIRQGLGREESAEGAGDDGDGEADEAPAGAPRRRVSSAALRRAAAAAGRLAARLARWPERGPVSEHVGRLRELLADDLGWPAGGTLDLLAPLERDLPGALPITFDELVFLLARSCRSGPAAGRDRLGGRGGGVVVLDAIEARGRTFRHLFLAGVDRGTFPRTVREDPLLADDLRRSLRSLLPDLPVKREGFDEERYLFAQLLAAAPAVTVSWRTATEEGQPLPPSPLVERLALSRPEIAAALRGGRANGDPANEAEAALLGPRDHAIAAGLAGDRQAFVPLLAVTLAAGRARLEAPGDEERAHDLGPALEPARRLAAVHGAILDELDPDLATPEGRAVRTRLGPYFGFVGPIAAAAPRDPRKSPIYVTALERLAGCPWQTFLQRLLRIEPTPDPLGALPALDPLSVGLLVHAALEEIVRGGLREAGDERREETLDDVLAEEREPVAVPWPEVEELDRLLHRQAERLLEADGVVLPGLARALARAARPYVAKAGEIEWAEGPVPVLAAEVSGRLAVEDAEGAERELHFRADRVDPVPGRRNAAYLLTDYKTGRPVSTAKKQETRVAHLLRDVESGRRLQAVAYALAAGDPSPFRPDGVGRYLFLRPDLADDLREHQIWGNAVPFVEAFRSAVRTALEAWDRGTFFPRLVEPDKDDEPGRCRFCPVHEACLRGDSGARGRLAAWADARRQPTLDLDAAEGAAPAERALLGVWLLPAKEPA